MNEDNRNQLEMNGSLVAITADESTIEGSKKRKIGNPNKKPVPLSKKTRKIPNSSLPEYYFEQGLRKVKPYEFIYQTYAKQRWLGLTLYRVFEKEFNDKSALYYKKAIETGKITVNGLKVELDYIIQNSDLIENRVHRHEPPVNDQKIDIVHESEDILVISKPGSMPVHPTGRYYHNTATMILANDGYKDLHPVNRIDRLTSGLILFARNKTKAASMMKMMQNRDIQKTYYARVRGKFPHEQIECNQPIETVSHKAGVNMISPNGKPCSTGFKFVSFNGITSLVECQPKTGRTHQIRVHLQYLGFPIANDPLYCSSAWDQNDKELGQVELVNRVTDKVFAKKDVIDDYEGCFECRDIRRDPCVEELSIWLHSFRYLTDQWSYETPLPYWALEGFDGDKDIQDRFWKYGGLWDGTAPGEHVFPLIDSK
jgi:tRNA pseudouridine synthase 9